MAEAIAVVRPKGRLDSSTSGDFAHELQARIDAGDRLLILDFSDVTFVSSAGLRVLLSGAKQIKVAGGRLAICSLSKQVREILDITGCTTLLDVYLTVDAAKTHLMMM